MPTSSITATYPTRNPGQEITRIGYTLKVPVSRGGLVTSYYFDFADHPLREAVLDWLTHDPTRAANTIAQEAGALRHLGRFLVETGRTEITGPAFAELLLWVDKQPGQRRGREREKTVVAGEGLPSPRRSESGRRQVAEVSIRLYEFAGTAVSSQWNQHTLEDMRERNRTHFLSSEARHARRRSKLAFSDAEYARLLRALRMELDECQAVLDTRDLHDPTPLAFSDGFRGIDPNPFVPFAVLAALEMGLRSAEFNVARLSDVDAKPGFLWAHAPNKRPRYIRITPQVRRTLDLVIRWTEEIRPQADNPTPLLLHQLGNNPRQSGIFPITSSTLNSSALPRFYRKYFKRTEAVEGEERPILYADPKEPGGRLVRLAAPLADYRGVGAEMYASLERDKEAVRRHLDHRSLQTTERYYQRQQEEDRLRDTGRFLLPAAEKLRMLLQNEVVDDPAVDQQEQLKEKGALIPGGHCNDALIETESTALTAGYRAGCTRAMDCRLCENFRIHVGRRELFVLERDRALRDADRLQQVEGKLRDAENLRQFAALNEAIIARIEEHQQRGVR